jgi:hypothetical protein
MVSCCVTIIGAAVSLVERLGLRANRICILSYVGRVMSEAGTFVGIDNVILKEVDTMRKWRYD